MVTKVFRTFLPPEVRAFCSYLLSSREVTALPVVFLQRKMDDDIDAITHDVFREIERELDEATERGTVEPTGGCVRRPATFDYDTRLLLPAMLTHGYLHAVANDVPVVNRFPGTSVDRGLVEATEHTTYSITQALLDGDMRDAINDEEFADFVTNRRPKRTVAEIAQRYLQSEVTAWLEADETPEAVSRHYSHAVAVSESHQDDDPKFRALFDRLTSAPEDEYEEIVEDVIERYKFETPTKEPALFQQELSLPYFTTQYERVGIIYEDMLGMYEADVGVDVGADFKRAVVLMVIAAQIGLDDTDDYPEDRETQLTPVTAELSIASTPAAGVDAVRSIVETYLDRAMSYSPTPITGIAIEYIRQQSLVRIADLPDTES